MDIHISFQDGPIEAEIEAGADDDYREVLNRLSEFVEQHDMQSEQTTTDTPSTDSSTPSENIEDGNDADEKDDSDDSVDSDDSSSQEVKSLQDFSEDRLYRVVKQGKVEDGEIIELPEIIGNVSVLGDHENKRALHGAVVLLTILNDFHDVSKVKTSELKEALGESGIKKDAFNDVDEIPNEKVFINRRGRGNSATTEIRYPGKQEGRSLVKDIIEESL